MNNKLAKKLRKYAKVNQPDAVYFDVKHDVNGVEKTQSKLRHCDRLSYKQLKKSVNKAKRVSR